MEGAVAPVAPWMANVSQRNAPGAIRAIAFIVRPVRPKVAFISGAVSAIRFPYFDVLLFSDFTERHCPVLSILPGGNLKGKLKFLMNVIRLFNGTPMSC